MLPIHSKIPIYNKFFMELQPNCGAKIDEVKGEDEVKPEDEDADEDEQEGSDEDGNSISFLKFLKTLVVHFTAKRALERQCFRLKNQDVTISLFSVDRTSLCISAGSWSAMKNTIKELFTSGPTSTSTDDTATPTKAIAILETELKKLEFNSKHVGLIQDFKRLTKGEEIRLNCGLHCEAVLETVSKYVLGSDNLDDKAKLTSTCKVFLLFNCFLGLSEHLSLVATSVRYDFCVQTMLSSVLGAIEDIEGRRTLANTSWLSSHRLSRRIARMASFSNC